MSWSQEEKDLLISLYAEHSDKEICDILNKTPGQIRGIKERLHLNAKMIPFTEAEKQRIVEWYTEHPDTISLDDNSRIRIEKFRKYYPTEFEKLVIIGEKEYLCIEKIYSRTIHMWESTKTKRIKGGKANG